MNRKVKREKKENYNYRILSRHIQNNKKNYCIVCALFFIGIIMGVFFINYTSADKVSEISDYLRNQMTSLQSNHEIELGMVFKESMINNIILIIVLWISASTIIGIPIVYGTVLFRGFSLSYTISSILIAIGTGKGILFGIASLLFHNLILIPVLFASSVSGINLYQSIMKDKRRENVKIEFIRHTIFCVVMLLVLGISSLIETYISTNLAKFTLNCIKI